MNWSQIKVREMSARSGGLKKTYRQRAEGRSARLIFIFGIADDFDELSRLLHLRELLAEDGREVLRKNV